MDVAFRRAPTRLYDSSASMTDSHIPIHAVQSLVCRWKKIRRDVTPEVELWVLHKEIFFLSQQGWGPQVIYSFSVGRATSHKDKRSSCLKKEPTWWEKKGLLCEKGANGEKKKRKPTEGSN